MILRPAFYRAAAVDRDAELRALGLDPSRPTGIVMFGGQGAAEMAGIARRLDEVQLILLCGRNETLLRRLRALRRSAPHAALGFTEDIARTMRLGNFFIGKPGPGSLSEAVHCGLPVITFDNAWTMPQERYNTRWVRESGVGLVRTSLRSVRAAVTELLSDLPAYRSRVAAIDNRAVFEVPEILDSLMRSGAAPPRSASVVALAA